MGNAPSNQPQTGFNPNMASFSGGFSTGSNMKSFASLNTNTNQQSLFSGQNAQQQPNIFSNHNTMNSNISNQGNMFGQSQGNINNPQMQNNNVMGMGMGMYANNPQQQQGNTNFLAGFNPSNTVQKQPVAPGGNISNLLKPRK